MQSLNEAALTTFGQWLMTEVRDSTIEHWTMILSGKMGGIKAEEVQRELANWGKNERTALEALVPKVVDTTLHYLLFGLEQISHIKVSVQTSSGEVSNIAEVSDGLAGEVYGTKGWIARFSKEAGA
jgi:hypothetical protein